MAVLDTFLWTKVKFPAFGVSLLSQIPNKVAFLLDVFEFFLSLHTLWLPRSTPFTPSTAPISGSCSICTTRPLSPLLPAESHWAVTQLRTCSEPGGPKPNPRSAISLSLSSNWTSVLQLYGPDSLSFLLIFTVPMEVTNFSTPHCCTAEDEIEF